MFSPMLYVCIGILFCVEVTVGHKKCQDCMPYKYCGRALKLVQTGKNNMTNQLFKDAFCGTNSHNISLICCSEFDIPDFRARGPEVPPHPKLNLLPKSCGIIAEDRILGGVEASLYEFPWMALIAYGDDYKFGCSGSLINSRYVLSAAHCVVNKDIRFVRIGDYDLQRDIDCRGNVCENTTQDREMESYEVHDGYDLTMYTNDIALIRLKHPVTLKLKNADTICLPTTTELQKDSITNKQATVAGWGLTEHGQQSNILLKVDITVRSPTACNNYYSHIFDSESNQFCAGNYKKDSCKGDSGGPLMMESVIKNVTKIVQYGIVSNGLEQCGTKAPGIYTDVRKYMEWILDNIYA